LKEKFHCQNLLNWGIEKRFKLENERLRDFVEGQCPFSPEVDLNSKKMIRGRDRSSPIGDRLYKDGKDSEKRKVKKRKLELESLFSPKLSDNTRRIAAKREKEDFDLIRKENGITENLDFWKAEPAGINKLTLTRLHTPPRKKSDGESTISTHCGTTIGETSSRCGRCSKFDKTQKELIIEPKKTYPRKDPNPEYVSPFTKELLMETGIPLKKLMKKTKRQNKRNKGKRKEGLLSLSRSRSRLNLFEEERDEMPLKKQKKKFRRSGKKKNRGDEELEVQTEKNVVNKKRRAKKLLYLDDLDQDHRVEFLDVNKKKFNEFGKIEVFHI